MVLRDTPSSVVQSRTGHACRLLSRPSGRIRPSPSVPPAGLFRYKTIMVTRKKAAKKKARLRTKEDVHAAKAETLLVLLGAQLTDVSTLLFGLSAQLADRDDAKIQRTVADAALNRVEQQDVVSKAAL